MKKIIISLIVFVLFYCICYTKDIVSSAIVTNIKQQALQGNIEAIRMLAGLYHDGKGVEKNHKEAFKWSLLGAERGDVVCQRYTAIYYNSGQAGEKNADKAMYWSAKAAERGDEIALKLVMALHVIHSKNNPKYLKMCVVWLYISSYLGDTEAEAYLDEIRKDVSEEEYQNAIQLAEMILKSIEKYSQN